MQDGIKEPAPVLPTPTVVLEPTPANEPVTQIPDRRSAQSFWLGGSLGLVVGVLLTLGAFSIYTFFVHTLPSTRDSIQVFNELNELRKQLNQLNEEKKHMQQEEHGLRQALSLVATTTRVPATGTAGAASPTKKEGETPTPTPVRRARGPFAEVDAEIERLEQTQKVLNNILDLFPTQGKDSSK